MGPRVNAVTKSQTGTKNLIFVQQALDWLHKDATYQQACDFYEDVANNPNTDDFVIREFGRYDRFFLLTHLLHGYYMLHPWIYDRVREVEASPDGHIDLWAREHGKDLADDTPVLTHNRGWTTHGQLVIGDYVYAPDGKPVCVVALSQQYNHSHCYRLTFSDGHQIVAGAGHLWRVRRKIRRRQHGSEARRVEWFDDVIDTESLQVHDDVGVLSESLIGVPQQLPIHPYVLGCWLGDGNSSDARLTCAYSDNEIIDKIRDVGTIVHEVKSSNKNTGLYRLGGGVRGKKNTGMTAQLRQLGLIDNKHIPKNYMTASVHQRMELLRGLMDTDGTCNTRGNAEFCNKNEQLARQVYELAAGLALRPRLQSRTVKSGRYAGNTYHHVYFQAHKDRNPFHLSRKAKLAIEPSKHRYCRDVVNIERIDGVPTRCIQVDSKGGMYVVGHGLIPTHNSTIITFAGAIQEIIKDPEITIGIFSHTRPTAKGFLTQIQRELETNKALQYYYSDIFYDNPRKDARVWSSDAGIVVKRKGNPREMTVEAWGLVDGQPTGKHFGLLIYDDVVTLASVTTAEQIEKTTDAWDLSLNLGSKRLDGTMRRWIIGTRYSFADTYHEIMERGAAIPRIHPATDDGTIDGKPVYLTPEAWANKKRDSSLAILACQQLQNPNAGGQAEFKPEYLRYYEVRPQTLNVYVMCDYAGSRKSTGSSRTAFGVIGVDHALNKYLLDGACHRMGLTDRWDMLKALRTKWRAAPGVQHVDVGYERFGAQSDIEYFEEKMRETGDAFPIRELAWPQDGTIAKDNRIRRLEPDFRAWGFFLPYEGTETASQRRARSEGQAHLIAKPIKRVNEERHVYNLVEYLINTEFLFFPNTTAKDLLDAMSRIYDMEPTAPIVYDSNDLLPEVGEDG